MDKKKKVVINIIEKYKDHPSVKTVKSAFPAKEKSKIEPVTVKQVSKIVKDLNVKKATINWAG